jgi:biotin transporter BioY
MFAFIRYAVQVYVPCGLFVLTQYPLHPVLWVLVGLSVLIASSKLKITLPYTTVPITAQTLIIHLLSFYFRVPSAIIAVFFLVGVVIGLPFGASKVCPFECVADQIFDVSSLNRMV